MGWSTPRPRELRGSRRGWLRADRWNGVLTSGSGNKILETGESAAPRSGSHMGATAGERTASLGGVCGTYGVMWGDAAWEESISCGVINRFRSLCSQGGASSRGKMWARRAREQRILRGYYSWFPLCRRKQTDRCSSMRYLCMFVLSSIMAEEYRSTGYGCQSSSWSAEQGK